MHKTEKHIAQVNGANVTYYKFGSGGEPLLFLHGGRTSVSTYGKLLIGLSKRYTIIAPDIPGYGQSDTPSAAWSFVEYAECMNNLLEKLEIEKTTVMGYSMGGGIAAVLASTSNRVSALILIDASGIRNKAGRGRQDLRRLWFYMSHPQYASAFVNLVLAIIRFSWKHRFNRSRIKSTQYKCFTTPYEDYFKSIKVPTKLIWGDKDWIYPLEVAHAYQQMIPNTKLFTVSGNHDWLVYDPLLLVATAWL